jgi:hypothetical protein
MKRAQKGHGDERTVAADSNVDFAKAVIDEYRRAVSGAASPGVDRDVRGVAIALATIQRALKRDLAEIKEAGGLLDLPSSGLMQAFRLIEALTTGRADPVWRLVDGLRSVDFRAQKAPPGNMEIFARRIVVGFVRAYEQVAEVSEAKAISKVIEACTFDDFVFRVDQIKGWSRRFRETNDEGPDAAARDLIEKAKALDRPWPLPQRVLAVGQTWVWPFFAVSKLGESPHSVP